MDEKRNERRPDRRRVPRGGRRDTDRPGRHPIVLVAEGVEAARVPYVQHLHRYNFQVEEAADGDEVLAVINATYPHVILVQRELPGLPAERLSLWLSQNWRTRHIPMIVLAGTINSISPCEQLVEYAAGVLVKPFEPEGMLDEIRRVLRTAKRGFG